MKPLRSVPVGFGWRNASKGFVGAIVALAVTSSATLYALSGGTLEPVRALGGLLPSCKSQDAYTLGVTTEGSPEGHSVSYGAEDNDRRNCSPRKVVTDKEAKAARQTAERFLLRYTAYDFAQDDEKWRSGLLTLLTRTARDLAPAERSELVDLAVPVGAERDKHQREKTRITSEMVIKPRGEIGRISATLTATVELTLTAAGRAPRTAQVVYSVVLSRPNDKKSTGWEVHAVGSPTHTLRAVTPPMFTTERQEQGRRFAERWFRDYLLADTAPGSEARARSVGARMTFGAAEQVRLLLPEALAKDRIRTEQELEQSRRALTVSVSVIGAFRNQSLTVAVQYVRANSEQLNAPKFGRAEVTMEPINSAPQDWLVTGVSAD